MGASFGSLAQFAIVGLPEVDVDKCLRTRLPKGCLFHIGGWGGCGEARVIQSGITHLHKHICIYRYMFISRCITVCICIYIYISKHFATPIVLSISLSLSIYIYIYTYISFHLYTNASQHPPLSLDTSIYIYIYGLITFQTKH